MRKDPQIIIGCPGRVLDFINRRILSSTLKMLILDEADEILSQGFLPQLQSIFTSLDVEQVVLFSATFPESLKDVTKKIMKSPEEILVKSEMLTLEGISQFYVEFETDHDKLEAIQVLFESMSMSQSIIYCNSVKRVCSLDHAMKEAGYPIHVRITAVTGFSSEAISDCAKGNLMPCS